MFPPPPPGQELPGFFSPKRKEAQARLVAAKQAEIMRLQAMGGPAGVVSDATVVLMVDGGERARSPDAESLKSEVSTISPHH